MRKSFALICFLLLLSSPALPQASSTKQRTLALTHVTVIDTTGGPNQALLGALGTSTDSAGAGALKSEFQLRRRKMNRITFLESCVYSSARPSLLKIPTLITEKLCYGCNLPPLFHAESSQKSLISSITRQNWTLIFREEVIADGYGS